MAKGVKKQNKFQTTMRMDNCHKQILSVKVVCGSKKKKSVFMLILLIFIFPPKSFYFSYEILVVFCFLFTVHIE